MLLVETEPIKAVVRLILREPTVSNFCKSWLYLKSMVENDDNIRLQLENGYNHGNSKVEWNKFLLFILTGLLLIGKTNSRRT